MNLHVLLVAAFVAVLPLAQAGSSLRPDPSIVCSDCDAWNVPREPYRVFGNTYYVGVAGLSSVLVTSDAGLILLDGGLPQSAPLIDANIRKLGFRTEDVRLILVSHEHFDHVGGVAALQRASGAVVAASAPAAQALARGEPLPEDPQYAFGARFAYPAVANVRAVGDGETLRVGNVAITAHRTPGHTPGGTTWTWRSCEGDRCFDVVYADSLNAVSAPGFRFTGDASHPSRVESFRTSIAKVGALPCDILIPVHPGFAKLDEKLAGREKSAGINPFVDPQACRTYAAAAGEALTRRIAEEQATGSASAAQPRAPFEIAGQSVAPGTRLDVDLRIPSGKGDPETYIPVTVLHGRTQGPVLAVSMGVHGYEFPPILAGQALLGRLDPAALNGTLILVRIAHVEAFENRVPFVNPHDRKNLNRAFPGRADGTQTDRIAWALTTEVIRRADMYVDVHSGDGAEWLEGFVGVYGGKLAAAQYATARRMALAFGFPNVIRYSMETQEQLDRGRSTNRQAVADGKPTVLVEMGENGRRDPAFVHAIAAGLENLLRTLGMTSGSPIPPRADTRWFDGSASAAASHTGIFMPIEMRGRAVGRGELLGRIHDYAGRLLEEIRSPVDGYVIYGLAGPPVKAGDSVATIALPAPGPL